ncbi:14234_t:CDS:1, partial [Acaulospora colombiana]
PYSVGHDSYGGPGRYIPPSQYMSGGYNPLESGGSNASPIYPPNRNLYNQPGAARGDYFPPGQQQPDGASLFSGYAPGPPRMPGQETGRPRVDSSSTGHGHPLSEVATTVPYGSTAYTANSNGSSRLPEHGHSVLNVSEQPLPPLPANNQSLALHTAPPLPAGRIPPRKGQVTLPPSATAEQQQEFRGLSEEELRRRRMNVEGREQDFGPLLMDDVLPSQPGVPLPPDYSQATEVLRR